ncbi:MAG: sulfatase-like hydrolase/transferase [Oligoflexia bacterium]|nr:sulfatase-like hydrolase/transferase [Oligoflexia bacterium]
MNSTIIRFYLAIIAFLLITLTVNRIIFALLYYNISNTNSFTVNDIFFAFYIGFKFDLRFILISLAPIFFLTAILKQIKINLPTKIIRIYLNLLCFLIFIFYGFDYGHYSYLQSRLSSTVLQMLENLQTSMQMIWQTYPVIPSCIGFIFILWIFDYIIKRLLQNLSTNTNLSISKFKYKIILLWIFIVLIWSAGIWGKISYYPLRWGEAYFTTNKYISSIALNPIMNFFDSWVYREQEYDINLTKKYYPVMQNYLKLDTDFTFPNFKRTIKPVIPHPLLKKPFNSNSPAPNVVVIIVESLVAYKTGMFNNPLGPTPYLDRIQKQAIFFPHFYVPSQATARSVFAFITGIPDVTAHLDTSSTRNPLVVDQNTILNEFKEHQKFYFLGGDANWGSIRGLLTNNISDIRIFEEKDYSFPRNDVWGISDYHLFLEANKVFKKEQKPFMAIVQTSGFHRPLTLPKDRGDFKLKHLNSNEQKRLLKEYGFESEDEYQSLLFQDYSIGNFFKQASKEKYFDNTIFVIFGDHGLPVNGAKNVPAGERIHDLENFHVPLLFYAPKIFDPQIIKKYVSEIDVLPILASIFGITYSYQALGRDIFDGRYNNNNADEANKLFVYYWYMRPSRYAIFDNKYFAPANTLGKKELFIYTSKRPGADESPEDIYKEKTIELNDLANGIYNTSKYMMYHNKK